MIRDTTVEAGALLDMVRNEPSLRTSMPSTAPISVIIPHHNRCQLIGAALASIQQQTIKPAEILIVDDASDQDQRSRLSDYAGIARIIYIDKNVGPAQARNVGMDAASGEFLAFLDDDDVWVPDKLERQWNILKQTPELAAVTSSFVAVYDGNKEVVVRGHAVEIITLKAALEGTPALLQTMLVRQPVLKALGGFDREFPPIEDQEFWIRFAAAGYKALHLEQPFVRVDRRRRERLTNHWWPYLRSQLRVVWKHRSLYETVLGRGSGRDMYSKQIRRAGIRKGGVAGRVVYAAGCILRLELRALLRLATTGRMSQVPYSRY